MTRRIECNGLLNVPAPDDNVRLLIGVDRDSRLSDMKLTILPGNVESKSSILIKPQPAISSVFKYYHDLPVFDLH